MNWALNGLPTYTAIKLDLNAGCSKKQETVRTKSAKFIIQCRLYKIKNLQFFPDLSFEVYPVFFLSFLAPPPPGRRVKEISRKYANIPSIGEKNTLPRDYMHI